VFLEAEGSARPKTSFFLKRRGTLVLASDRRERGNPDCFSGGLLHTFFAQGELLLVISFSLSNTPWFLKGKTITHS
ncbi:MAG: hypothetical protein ACFN4U_02695, partial [Candidatus Absconditicoccaceae bacterium]